MRKKITTEFRAGRQVDQKTLKRIVEIGFFKQAMLRHFFLISIGIALAMPLYHAFFIHPLFRDLLIEDKEYDAISIAKHLASDIVLEEGGMGNASLPIVSYQEAVRKGNEFGLTKLKVFSNIGEVIFSTDPLDVGEIHKGVHFQEVLAKGNVHTNVLKKGTKSLEGKTVQLDLVETYVPLIKDGNFLGAFEIYYDVTRRTDQLSSLLHRSFGLLVGLDRLLHGHHHCGSPQRKSKHR
jgi:hypothetical protein